MTDIFHEIQDDIRRDRLKAFWTRYGWAVIGVAALIVAAVGAWRGYAYLQHRAAADAGDRYQAASRLAGEGKAVEAREAFAKIAADAPPGYAVLARLREADEVARSDKPAALKLYRDVIAGDADPMLRDAARVRAALIAVDIASLDDVRGLAEPLAAGGPWSALAHEAIGLSAYKAGDNAAARTQFEAIVADPDAPGSIRQRADLLLAVLPPAAAPDAGPAKPTN